MPFFISKVFCKELIPKLILSLMHIIKIPYYSDSSIYFEKIRHFTWPIFLDSSYQSTMGINNLVHYDVLTANPFLKIMLLDNNEVAIHDLIKKKNNSK